MKNRSILLLSIGIAAFLLISSIAFAILNIRSPYAGYTGFGSSISVSPDDTALAFSYYLEGNESIYTGDLKTGQAINVVKADEQDYRSPKFSPDGNKLMYLAVESNDVQSIHYLENGKTTKLTGPETHVFNATFSPDGATVYYVGMPTDDFVKPMEERKNESDLYSVQLNGTSQKLTDKDAFSMHGLSVSKDGKTLFYSAAENQQELYAYDLEFETDSLYLPEYFQDHTYTYDPTFSPDGKFLAYTAAANEAENTNIKYELFLLETSTGKKKKLTDFNARVSSPSFFHQEDRIAFLVQNNWSDEPASYEAMTVDFDGNVSPLNFNLPEPSFFFQPLALANRFVNITTLAALYLLLFGLLSVYFHFALNKVYLPVKLSMGLTGIVLIGAFIALAIDLWASIFLILLGAALAACTLAIFAFAFVFIRIARRPV